MCDVWCALSWLQTSITVSTDDGMCVCQGGCVDSVAQSLSCVLMALGDQDVSKLQTGPLSNYT